MSDTDVQERNRYNIFQTQNVCPDGIEIFVIEVFAAALELMMNVDQRNYWNVIKTKEQRISYQVKQTTIMRSLLDLFTLV